MTSGLTLIGIYYRVAKICNTIKFIHYVKNHSPQIKTLTVFSQISDWSEPKWGHPHDYVNGFIIIITL